ncbi:MAG TPA: hypothetical protein VFU59_12250 [Candidatus Eisenbacteria bacterium]|nr:hypothetical protein [Candidatus Eisenbacteria bacterium]
MVTPRAGASGHPTALAKAWRGGAAPAPFLLAAGPSDYWREHLVEAYRASAADAGAEFLRLEGDDLDAETLAGALESLSLFAASRRLWIREGAKIEKACEERLLALAADPIDGVAILLTTAREPSELKFLGALAAKATYVPCEERPGDAAKEAQRLAAEAGLKLPGGLLEAITARAGTLQSLRQELSKLALLADDAGRIAPSSLDAVAAGRVAASVERWAIAALQRDGAAARIEAAALSAEGSATGSALWAVASMALAALEPQSYGYRRGPAGPTLRPAAARAALDAVYRADRAMKRGEIRDEEVLDVLERSLQGGTSVRDA